MDLPDVLFRSERNVIPRLLILFRRCGILCFRQGVRALGGPCEKCVVR